MAKKKKLVKAKRPHPKPARAGKAKTNALSSVTWISEEEANQLGIDEGSKIVKKLAEKQKINVKLTAEQLEAIRKQLKSWDNKRPAELTFLVEGVPGAKFRVAAYGYRKKTCCA